MGLLINCTSKPENNQEKPNIVWLVNEDNSVYYMDLYTKGGAKMPTIAELANKGIDFDNAFSNAPVLSEKNIKYSQKFVDSLLFLIKDKKMNARVKV